MWKSLVLKARLSEKNTFWIVVAVSCLAICASFFLETVLGKKPCFLCQVQRAIYFLLTPAALAGAVFSLNTIGRRCCALLLIAACLVASYHSLVQFKVVEDRCHIQQVGDVEAYKAMLLGRGQTRCSDSALSVGKIPISILNGLGSIILLWLILRKR